MTKIHLEFAQKWNDGHLGPRRFWRENLPRLKYHNPKVPMIVNRTRDQGGPSTLSIYITSQTPRVGMPGGSIQAPRKGLSSRDAWATITSSPHGEAKAPPPSGGERVVTINMKNVPSEDILAQLLEKSGAIPIEPSEEDIAEIRRIKELDKRREVRRAAERRRREALLEEKRMLEKSIQEANALKDL